MFEKLWSWLNEPKVVTKIRLVGDYLRWAIAGVALVVAALTDSSLILPLALSIGVAQLVIEGMKKIMNFTPWGNRPDGNDDGFPSGHVGGAFSGAWFFYFMYGFEVALIPIALGALTALSRVLAKKHSLVQVNVSIILTYVISQYFLT